MRAPWLRITREDEQEALAWLRLALIAIGILAVAFVILIVLLHITEGPGENRNIPL